MHHIIEILSEGLSKTAKKVTIDEAQNTVQSNKSLNNGLSKPSSMDLDPDPNELNGRFSVSPAPPLDDVEGIAETD